MKEDNVLTSSEGDNRRPAGGDGGHKRLGSASISSSSSDSSLTESPPVQLMERKSDAGSEEKEHYRFPSSVFSRTKSSNTTGKEWSINSNESLFSIHMGNMSFNKDLYWIAKSGELGEPLTSPRPPPPLPPPPSAPQHALPDFTSPPPAVVEGGKRKTKLDEGLCATPEAVETMKSILMDQSSAVASSSASLPRRSNESRDSTTSFAFPILTGNQSLKKNRQPPQKPREELAVESTKIKTPKAAPDPPAQAKWFGCFNCCSGGAS